jgi:hypothetical protein
MGSLIAAALALEYPWFWTLQLLYVMDYSATLRNVVEALFLNGKALIMTAILALIMIYILAFLAFNSFYTKFEHNPNFGEGYDCSSMLKCVLVHLVYGLRFGGGIGELLARPSYHSDNFAESMQVAFELVFFIFISIIVLNIVFGIIIDTFAELREQREHLLRHLSTKCLMCGIDASDFDQLASGFDHHVRFDHHIWHYIYFMHYLQLKPFYELSGLEQYVAEMVQQRCTDFLPAHQAACFGSSEKAHDEAALHLLEDLNNLQRGTKRQRLKKKVKGS